MNPAATPYYQDDHVTLYHGDALDVIPTSNLTGPLVVITDPPYGIAWRRGEGTARMRPSGHPGIPGDTDTATRDAALDLLAPAPAIVFGSFYAPPPARLRHVAVWEKPRDAGVIGATVGLRRDIEAVYLCGPWPTRPVTRGSVFRSTIPNSGNPASPAGRWRHPHAKPEDLMRDLIALAPDGLIVDPFAGSGSTLRAAKDLGRRAVGIEIDPDHCRTAATRCGQEVLLRDR